MLDNFLKDVALGLSADPKYIPSKYFYDEKGDKLFQAIMKMPEYYLTKCEYEIFSLHKEQILSTFYQGQKPFHLIEFGAGDGLKTKLLLRHFLDKKAAFKYSPIDISSHVLNILVNDLKKNFPALDVEALQGDYFDVLSHLKDDTSYRKVILFLGSNIGNFTHEKAITFLTKISENLAKDDIILIGFDLKKDPRLILNAYDDSAGITRAFNLNLLERMNKTLGANFQVDKFLHYPTYDPVTGLAKSYLISVQKQKVYIDKINKEVFFEAFEAIHVEISRKFDQRTIIELANKSNFEPLIDLHDCKHYYVDAVWKKV